MLSRDIESRSWWRARPTARRQQRCRSSGSEKGASVTNTPFPRNRRRDPGIGSGVGGVGGVGEQTNETAREKERAAPGALRRRKDRDRQTEREREREREEREKRETVCDGARESV